MFKLIAMVVFSVNGAPVGEPQAAVNNTRFESMAACTEFKDSERGVEALGKLTSAIKAAVSETVTISIKTVCEASEDNSI